jgi:ferric-dicitrate binding protein FerR (iron transport regulator)
MNFDRFDQLVRTLGGDIGRWPEAEQAAARDLAARDERARAALASALRLDALLHEAALPVSQAAAAQLVAAMLEHIRTPAPRTSRFHHWLWPIALMAGAALAGCATALERPQWLGLSDPFALTSALAQVLDADGSRF